MCGMNQQLVATLEVQAKLNQEQPVSFTQLEPQSRHQLAGSGPGRVRTSWFTGLQTRFGSSTEQLRPK